MLEEPPAPRHGSLALATRRDACSPHPFALPSDALRPLMRRRWNPNCTTPARSWPPRARRAGASLRRLDRHGAAPRRRDSVALAKEADRLLDQAAQPDIAAIMGLETASTASPTVSTPFAGFLTEALAQRIRARAQHGAPHLDRWSNASIA